MFGTRFANFLKAGLVINIVAVSSVFSCHCQRAGERVQLTLADLFVSASTPRIEIEFFGRPRGLPAVTLRDGSYHYLTAICWVPLRVWRVHSRLSPFDGYLLCLLWRFQRRWPGARFWIGVDPPHHGSVAVTFPQILNQRLSRVRSAVELFVLVDCHSEADVDIWTATMASTSSQLDEKVADLPYRRGPDQPSSSSLARRVRVQPLLLSLLLFVR